MTWEKLCSHGDDEGAVRRALLAEFDARWLGIARSIRAQLIEQGASLADALAATEQCRQILRNDAAGQAPRIMRNMAATASPTH